MCAIQQTAALIAEGEEFSTYSIETQQLQLAWHVVGVLEEAWRLGGCRGPTSCWEPPRHAHLCKPTHMHWGFQRPICASVSLFNFIRHWIMRGEWSSKVCIPLSFHSSTHSWSAWFREESDALQKEYGNTADTVLVPPVEGLLIASN